MLYNDQSPYTTALLVPAKDAVRGWLKEAGLSVRTPEGQEAVLRLLESELAAPRAATGGAFPGRWLPSAVAVLGEGFTEQNHMLNSTMKMVRGKIVEFYRTRIDYLYTPEGRSILNAAEPRDRGADGIEARSKKASPSVGLRDLPCPDLRHACPAL